MSVDELTETHCFKFVPFDDEKRWRLKHARFDANTISNVAFALKRLDYTDREVIDEMGARLDEVDFVKNNAQAVARKACEAYDAYQNALDTYFNADNTPDLDKPNPPSTTRRGAFPLVMNHNEGFVVTNTDDGLEARVSPQPYHPVRGELRGSERSVEAVEDALNSDGESRVGRAELLYRDGVYYLHVTVTTPADLHDPETAETIISVDVNERNIAISAFERDSMHTLATIVLDYGRVKNERQRLYDVRRRCQEHVKHSVVEDAGTNLERVTEWTLHRISSVVEHFVEWFSKPVVVFEDMSGIRDDMEYGSYMNRRLHQLPFHKFEVFATYKAHRRGAPVVHVSARDNSKRCACCGEKGSRRKGRFSCSGDECGLLQDHSDRNATVNTAVKGVALIEIGEDSHEQADNYRPRKTPPQARVRRVGSGRDVNRPTSSRSLAKSGVLHAT